jgi:hypothetical protein
MNRVIRTVQEQYRPPYQESPTNVNGGGHLLILMDEFSVPTAMPADKASMHHVLVGKAWDFNTES